MSRFDAVERSKEESKTHNNHNLILALNIVKYSIILSNEIKKYLLSDQREAS